MCVLRPQPFVDVGWEHSQNLSFSINMNTYNTRNVKTSSVTGVTVSPAPLVSFLINFKIPWTTFLNKVCLAVYLPLIFPLIVPPPLQVLSPP